MHGLSPRSFPGNLAFRFICFTIPYSATGPYLFHNFQRSGADNFPFVKLSSPNFHACCDVISSSFRSRRHMHQADCAASHYPTGTAEVGRMQNLASVALAVRRWRCPSFRFGGHFEGMKLRRRRRRSLWPNPKKSPRVLLLPPRVGRDCWIDRTDSG